jgi:hypothetical protein
MATLRAVCRRSVPDTRGPFLDDPASGKATHFPICVHVTLLHPPAGSAGKQPLTEPFGHTI